MLTIDCHEPSEFQNVGPNPTGGRLTSFPGSLLTPYLSPVAPQVMGGEGSFMYLLDLVPPGYCAPLRGGSHGYNMAPISRVCGLDWPFLFLVESGLEFLKISFHHMEEKLAIKAVRIVYAA